MNESDDIVKMFRGTDKSSRFFMEQRLHRTIFVDKKRNIIEAYDFNKMKKVIYPLTFMRKNSGRAYTLKEVCQMLKKNILSLRAYFADGRLPPPTPEIDLLRYTPKKYYASKEQILEWHELLLTYPRHPLWGFDHKNRMAKTDLPSKAELLAHLEGASTMYMKNQDGEFTPVWKEIVW